MLIDGKEYLIEMPEREYHCALSLTMDYVGGKWKSVILWYLRKGPKRYSDLRRQIPDITEKMLSLQLRELEKDGLVHRHVFAEVPPKVEYSLTELGTTLLPLLEATSAWGRMMAKKFGKIKEVER